MPAHHAPRSAPRPARVPPLAAALAALAALAAPGAPRALGAQAAGDTVRHVVLMAGNAAGTQRSWRTSDGAWHAHFTYNDRGRGPAIDEHVTLGADGLPTRIDVSGVDYMKNAVGERFERRDGVGTWRSAMERGSSRAPGFYMSMDGAPGETALLVRAALRRPDGAVPLLPAGRATVRAAARRTLRADGRERAVTLYEIADVGFQPAPVWLDADGELFAVGGSWQMTVREGWEAAAPELIAAQDSLASIRRAALASRLARRPATPVVFTNAAVFDPRTGTSARGMSVVVRGDRIERVGRGLPIPAGAERIDLAGRTLMPGMWDMHVHAGDDGGLLFLAAGITTVRDLGAGDVDETVRRRGRFDDGTLLGPRMLTAGLIDGPGPFQAPAKDLVSSEDQARATVEKFARLGYQQIKLYSSLDPKLVPLLAREAHARGLRVSGHVPQGMTAAQAVEAGFDELQHANFLFLNFWADSVGDTRTPVRFTAVADRAAGLDLDGQRVRDFVALLKARGTVVDPTVNIFEDMFVARKGVVHPGFAMIGERLPLTIRRGLLLGGLPVPEGKDARYRASFDAVLGMVKRLHDAGVPIVAGTDAFEGFSYHRELELYARAGIPNADVLRIATLGAAQVMKRDADLGTIEPGKLADLVVVDGDPLARISDVRRVTLVMKGGTLYDPAALYRAIGVRPAVTAR